MSRRAETNDVCYWRAVGENVDNDDDNDIIDGMSDILIVCNLLFCYRYYHFYYYYSPWKYDFRSGPKSRILQNNPLSLPVIWKKVVIWCSKWVQWIEESEGIKMR